jgi:hypothetical protein
LKYSAVFSALIPSQAKGRFTIALGDILLEAISLLNTFEINTNTF